MRRDPRETERALLEIAWDQGGYFTAAQALSVGYTYRQQHFHRQRSNWIEVDRGLFRLRNYPGGPHEDLIRWALWSRNRKGDIQAVVSHESALGVHELSDVMPARLHLTVPPRFRKKIPGGCVLHRAILTEHEIERHNGFLVTTPERTLCDVAEGDLSPEHLVSAVRDALARGMIQRRLFDSAHISPLARRRLLEAMENIDRRKEAHR